MTSEPPRSPAANLPPRFMEAYDGSAVARHQYGLGARPWPLMKASAEGTDASAPLPFPGSPLSWNRRIHT